MRNLNNAYHSEVLEQLASDSACAHEEPFLAQDLLLKLPTEDGDLPVVAVAGGGAVFHAGVLRGKALQSVEMHPLLDWHELARDGLEKNEFYCRYAVEALYKIYLKKAFLSCTLKND